MGEQGPGQVLRRAQLLRVCGKRPGELDGPFRPLDCGPRYSVGCPGDLGSRVHLAGRRGWEWKCRPRVESRTQIWSQRRLLNEHCALCEPYEPNGFTGRWTVHVRCCQRRGGFRRSERLASQTGELLQRRGPSGPTYNYTGWPELGWTSASLGRSGTPSTLHSSIRAA